MTDITIRLVIDVIGALESGVLAPNVYLFDNNRRGGSTGHGTAALDTSAAVGDRLIWTIAPMECGTYCEIAAIDLPEALCTVKREVFAGTNVSYWTGAVFGHVDDLPYTIALGIGHYGLTMTLENGPRLSVPAIEVPPQVATDSPATPGK